MDYGRRVNLIKIIYIKISGGRNCGFFEFVVKYWMWRLFIVCILLYMVISWWKERGNLVVFCGGWIRWDWEGVKFLFVV